MPGSRVVPLLALAAALAAGCGDVHPGDGDADARSADAAPTLDFEGCGPNLHAVGPACVPTFSDCSGDDEVPLPGGGCKRVGVRVRQDDAGLPCIEAPPDWKCTRVGAHECSTSAGGPGIKAAPDWGCKAIGAPLPCLPGWRVGADGWCEPPAHATDCGPAAMAMIGHASCQPVGDCGSSRWGNASVTSETIHVDAAHVGLEDGSAAAPFRSIARALQAAPRPGRGHIVVAAGRYAESLVIDRPVQIEGRCAAQVTIVGTAVDRAAFEISARDVAISGVTITGRAGGVHLHERAHAALHAIVVRDCEGEGVAVEQRGEATVRDSLLRSNRGFGLVTRSGTLLVERCTVRDTRAELPTREWGAGIAAFAWDKRGPPTLTVRRCLIARNRAVGVAFEDGKLLLEQSIVSGTREQAVDRYHGWGIYIANRDQFVEQAAVRDSSVLFNRGAGLVAGGYKTLVERVVIAGTAPHVDGSNGQGINAGDPRGRVRNTLVLRDSVIARNHEVGVWVLGSLDGARIVVRDTRTLPGTYSGEGLLLIGGRSTLVDITSRGNGNRGLYTGDAMVTVTRALIEGTRAPNGRYRGAYGVQTWRQGTALTSSTETDIDVRDSLLRDNPVGFELRGARGRLSRSAVIGSELNGVRVYPVGRTKSKAVVEDCLVSGGHYQAFLASRSDASIARTVLRDAQAYADVYAGIALAAYGAEDLVPSVELDETLVARSQSGVDIQRANMTIRRSAIEDMDTAASTAQAGYCMRLVGHNDTSLAIDESTVRRCMHTGIEVSGSRLVMTGSEVRAIEATDMARAVFVYPNEEHPGTLIMQDSAVAGAAGIGIVSRASSTQLTRVLVRDITTTADGRYGLAVGADDQSFEGGKPASSAGSLEVDRLRIEHAAFVGIGYVRTGGSLARSEVHDSGVAVYLSKGASPRIDASNRFVGNADNRISFGDALELPGPTTIPQRP